MPMCVGMLPGVPALLSRYGAQPPSCVDTAFGISLNKGQEKLDIHGMAFLTYKNISSAAYFLGVFFLGDYSLCFYSLMRKGKEINAIVIGHEEVYVIW